MTSHTFRYSSTIGGLCILAACVSAEAQDSADERSDSVRAAMRTYVEAFNSNDAAAVSALWAENAVYVDRETGDRLEGREALHQDFAGLFEDRPGIRLAGEVISVDFITDDVALVEGRATVFVADAEPNQASFSASFVRDGSVWMMHSVHESNLPEPETAGAALEDLEWMLGRWVDDSDANLTVDTTVKWAPGGSYIIRAYVVHGDEGVQREGTQIIGWDPRAYEIRSWTFNSDGSFGDGVWSQVGDTWHVKSTQTLADGAAASGTYVITATDDDSMSIQLIGHEIDGTPQPSSDVVSVVRSQEQGTTSATTGGAE